MIFFYYFVMVPLAACFIANWSGVFQALKIRFYGPDWWKHSWKPLDCEKCLSFWLSVILLTLQKEWSYASLIYPFVASAIAVLIKKYTKL